MFQGNLFEENAGELMPLSADLPASRPVSRETAEDARTIDGYGLSICAWCVRLIPCGCWRRTLAESLHSKLTVLGSALGLRHSFSLSVTRFGPSASLLKISVRHTRESESGLLPDDATGEESARPTPTVNGNHNRKGCSATSGDGLSTKVMALARPTPCCPNGGRKPAKPMNATGQTEDGKKRQVDLNYAVTKLWPTPRASANENRTTKRPPSHGNGHGRCLAGEVMELENWRTPNTVDVDAKGGTRKGEGQIQLVHQVKEIEAETLASWATPTSRDYRSIHASQETLERNSRPLSEQVGQLDPESSNMHGKSRASLSPRWTLQLMGLPEDWLDGVDVPSRRSGTPVSPRSRK